MFHHVAAYQCACAPQPSLTVHSNSTRLCLSDAQERLQNRKWRRGAVGKVQVVVAEACRCEVPFVILLQQMCRRQMNGMDLCREQCCSTTCLYVYVEGISGSNEEFTFCMVPILRADRVIQIYSLHTASLSLYVWLAHVTCEIALERAGEHTALFRRTIPVTASCLNSGT